MSPSKLGEIDITI